MLVELQVGWLSDWELGTGGKRRMNCRQTPAVVGLMTDNEYITTQKSNQGRHPPQREDLSYPRHCEKRGSGSDDAISHVMGSVNVRLLRR